jgi:hypothetical protein
MAEKTRIEQESIEVTLEDGSTAYQITTEVLEPGILPDTGLFVFRIVDPLDPKDDAFERVAQPKDINFLSRDRDQAILDGDEEFMYFKVVLQYTDLEVAIQAKDAVKSRIDSSISAWYQYETEFAGTEETLHPGVDPEFEQALKDAYKAARDARIAADAEVAQAEEDLEDAETALEHSQEIEDIRRVESEFCLLANETYWPVVQAQAAAIKAAGDSQYSANQSFDPAASLFDGEASTYESVSQAFLDSMIADYNAFPTSGPGTVYPASPSNSDWDDFFDDISAFDGTPGDFGTAQDVFSGALSTWEATFAAYLTAKNDYESTGAPAITNLSAALTTFCSNASAAYSAAVADVSQKETDVATAVAAKNEAEANAASAQEAEDAALAAVREVCPSFETTDV